MRDDDEQMDGKRILYWSELPPLTKKEGGPRFTNPAMQALATGIQAGLESLGYLGRNPQEWVIRTVDRESRELVGNALAQGKVLMRFMGYAECRLCGRQLGSADLYGFGFIWPEKAEHYVLDHDVWTPECNELYAELLKRKRKEKS